MPSARGNNLRFEYEKCQEIMRHYDTLNWQIGSILVAGLVTFSGIVTAKVIEEGCYSWLPFVGGLDYLLMIIWIEFFLRHRKLYNLRVERMKEIERDLGMDNFVRAATSQKNKELGPVSGFQLAIILSTVFPLTFFILYLIAAEGTLMSIIFFVLTTLITVYYNFFRGQKEKWPNR